jgi:mannosyl-glycoprotein endo-beta-N-acetylglucosaminidase
MNVSYFHNLPSSLTSSHPILPPKALRDIFIGVDVWGRGQHGGGGLGCFRALDHISPSGLGLSVALFGQAWTWESEQDKPGWDWDQWWTYERTLWIGPEVQGTAVQVPPPPPRKQGEAECSHEAFAPISNFFKKTAAPDPKQITFFSIFSPGVGRSWFVEGRKVFQSEHGWTDVDKQTSLGDLLWPRPCLAWESEDAEGRKDPLPKARTEIDMTDGWNGGSSARVWFSGDGSEDEDAIFRCVQLPVQSLDITHGHKYEAEVVYKTGVDQGVDFDIGFSVKLDDGTSSGIEITPGAFETDLQGGWARQTLSFITNAPDPSATHTVTHFGLVVGFATDDPTAPYKCSVSLGQLSVYPSPSSSSPIPKILWADFQRDPFSPGSSSSPLSGVLTWDTAISLPRLMSIRLTSPDDPNPVWSTAEFMPFPTFAYFNVYVEVASPSQSPGVLSYAGPSHAAVQFIGTTGLTGTRNELYIDKQMVPQDLLMSLAASKEVRFYVQGVTDRGKVLDWTQCAFVTVSL